MDESLKAWHRDQIDKYRAEFPTYEQYAKTMEEILRAAIKARAPFGIVQSRPKSVGSFAEKCLRKRHKYDNPVTQLTDLCGARVIVNTLSELEALSEFVETHFVVDKPNSDTFTDRLKPSEFGYRSVHYIVQLPETDKVADIALPPEIEDRTAEIQLRTFLQHAWAELAHDRLYKNKVKLPRSLEREVARFSAALEDTEASFDRWITRVDGFNISYGAHLSAKERASERETLDVLIAASTSDEDRRELALRAARLAKADDDWKKIVDLLTPHTSSDVPAVLREVGYARCRASASCEDGQALIERAAKLDPDDDETKAALAKSWQLVGGNDERVRDYYGQAYALAPENPYHLAAFLEYELFCHRQGSALIAAGPAMVEATEICGAHVAAGVELPWAYFTKARLHLLDGKPTEALSAYCQGIRFCREDAEIACIDAERKSIARISQIRTALPNGGQESDFPVTCIENLLCIARAVISAEAADLGGLAAKQCRTFDSSDPVLIVAGGCRSQDESTVRKFKPHLEAALADFRGTIVGGGTAAGISGVLADVVAGRDDVDIRLIAYHPRLLSADTVLDAQRYELVEIQGTGSGFSWAEPLQTWIDLIASGIGPRAVRVLGVSGGEIAQFELELATALGASVAVLPDSGRAAKSFADDEYWSSADNAIALPDDEMAVCAFVNLGLMPLDDDQWESAAKAIHAAFLEENRHKRVDPACKDWKDLDATYRISNKLQAAYIEPILRRHGFGVRATSGAEPAPTPKDVMERLESQVDAMAEMEHGRWIVDRLRDGWVHGEKRSLEHKTHPDLVPWEQLDDDVREYDRQAVREFPRVLAAIGLEIYIPD